MKLHLSTSHYFSTGIMGTYIGNLFDEVKNRPEYIVKETVNFTNRERENDPEEKIG